MKGSDKPSQKCKSGHLILKEYCPDCKTLKAEWYNNLSSTGFSDIEKNDYLRTTQSSNYIRVDFQTENQFEARRSYYQWAQEKTNQGRFDSTKDKLIWQYHAQGESLRDIGPKLGYGFQWIGKKIHKIESYLKEQAVTVGSMCFNQSIA